MCALQSEAPKSDCFPLEIRFLNTIKRRKLIFRCLQICMVGLHVTLFIISQKGKCLIYDSLEHFNHGVVKFVNCLSDFMLLSFNLLVWTVMPTTEVFVELVNFAWNNNLLMGRDCSALLTVVWVLRLSVFVPILINIYFLACLIGWDLYQYYLLRDVEYWGHNLVIVIYTFLALRLVKCFSNLNNVYLREFSDQYLMYNRVSIIQKSDTNKLINVNGLLTTNEYLIKLIKLRQTFNNLCDIVDKINESTKQTLNVMIMCIIGNIMYDCTTLIEFGIKPRIIKGFEITPYIFAIHLFFGGISVVSIVLSNIFFQLMVNVILLFFIKAQAALVGYVGEALKDEGQNTTKYCYSLQSKLPAYPQSETHKLIEKQLNQLLDESKSRQVGLHAGGCDITWGILGTIASTVSTYCIVIIQFLVK